MTLKQLEAFYWAAHLASFAIAAERLHVTQSSLSKRIAELEQTVGAQLFDRSNKRARLTDVGQRLVELAGQMLELKESMHAQVNSPKALSGPCRFGVSELVSLTWLPAFVRAVRTEHPTLVLQPYVDLARNLERRLLRGELDFILALGPADSDHVTGTTISAVKFTWVASPLRFKKSVVLRREELERHPMISQTEGSGVTRAVDLWANEHGIRVNRALFCNSFMAILGLTLADLGICFLPAPFIQPWISSGALIALRSDPPVGPLNYAFQIRVDDKRALLSAMHAHVMNVADFDSPPAPSALPTVSSMSRPSRKPRKPAG
jgi:DNA-binding transcriptional LysR family regulator